MTKPDDISQDVWDLILVQQRALDKAASLLAEIGTSKSKWADEAFAAFSYCVAVKAAVAKGRA